MEDKHYHFVTEVNEEDIAYIKDFLRNNRIGDYLTFECDDELFGKIIKNQILKLLRAIQVWEKPS